jgi:hypothetical protein
MRNRQCGDPDLVLFKPDDVPLVLLCRNTLRVGLVAIPIYGDVPLDIK